MKTLKLKYLITAILLFTISNVNSQSDSGLTYFPNNILIDYDNGTMESTSMTTGQKKIVPVLISIVDVNKIRFLSDSLISISNDQKSDLQLNISKINEISIKSGTLTGFGIGLGALFGLGLGLLVGSIADKHDHKKEGWIDIYISPTAVGALVGTPIGALIGGIIGGKISAYETYEMNSFKYDKKKELERILKIDKKVNGKGF